MSEFNESDRLFARLATERSYVTPAQVEEARTYLAKLGPLPVPLSLAVILRQLGRVTMVQVQAVQKDMEPFAFTCVQCGTKTFRLEYGDGETKCERCRTAKIAAGADPPAAAAAEEKERAKRKNRAQSFHTDMIAADAERARKAKEPEPPPAKSGRPAAPERTPRPEPKRPASPAAEKSGRTPPGPASAPTPAKAAKPEPKRTAAPAPAPARPASPVAEKSPRPPLRLVEPPGDETAPAKAGSRADFPTLDLSAPSGSGVPTMDFPSEGGTDARTELVSSNRARARDGTPAKGFYEEDVAPGAEPRRAEPANDPLIGKVLGGAKIEKLIGRGGMGSVYRATQLDLERAIAVKVLLPQYTSDPKQVAQFFKEAKALAKLDHPNIVTIFNVGKEDETHFIHMQLVEGGSLEHFVRRSNRLSIEQACNLTDQAARGLLEAHTKGIVHRDVKPENMLVSGETLKLTDFGLARMAGDQGFQFSSQRIVGTPYYMSPEQIDGRQVDSRTDIYALGATFYYLLTGERPFTADTPVDILLKHVNEPLIPPKERRRDIPEELSRLVCKMLVKEPDDRYQSVKEVLRDLEAARKGQAISVELPAAPVKVGDFVEGSALSATQALVPEPIAIVRPRSFYYAAGGLGVAGVLAVVLLAGPFRAILAEGAEERRSSIADVAIERALDQVRAVEARAGPRAAAEAARKLAADLVGSQTAVRAGALAEELQKKAQAAAKTAAEALLAEARQHRQAQRYGAALESLASLAPAHKGFDSEALLLAEAQDVRAYLARERGVAYIPSGPFLAGEDDWKKTASIDGFYMDLLEVSNRDWAGYVQRGGKPPAGWNGKREPPQGQEDWPVSGVSFDEALAFAAHTGGKRLPTELEWEKAARGTDGRRYPWGDQADPAGLARLLNCLESGPGRPEPVSSRAEGASPYGCLNMAGNVAEWVVRREGGRDLPRVKGGGYSSSLLATRAAFYDEPQGAGEAETGVGLRLARDVER